MDYRELITNYLNGTTTQEEKEAIEELLKKDAVMQQNTLFLKEAMLANAYFMENGIKDQLSSVWDKNEQTKLRAISSKNSVALSFYGLAASFALLFSFVMAIYWINSKNNTAQLQPIKKDTLENTNKTLVETKDSNKKITSEPENKPKTQPEQKSILAIQVERYKDRKIAVIDNQIGKYRNPSVISSPKIDAVFENSKDVLFEWSAKFNQQSLTLEIFTKDKNSSQTIALPNDSTHLKIALQPDLYYWYLLNEEGEQLELGRFYVKE